MEKKKSTAKPESKERVPSAKSELDRKAGLLREKPQPKERVERPLSKADLRDLNAVKHSFVAAGTTFTVTKRYEYIKVIGQGAYGVVCAAHDRIKNRKVAIKKVPNAFADLIDAKRIVREIKLLEFYDHENIISLLDVLKPDARTNFEDIYFVTDLMETDLHRVIYSHQELTDDHIQYFVYQVLRGMLYIHSSSVIHRDLKPSNLLLNKSCDLKICDFGLARGIDMGESENGYTEYVVTRWYRAPEVILNASNYTKALDIWSIGCIMAELLGRTPLFPGTVLSPFIKDRTGLFGPDKKDNRSSGNTERGRHGICGERAGAKIYQESAAAESPVLEQPIPKGEPGGAGPAGQAAHIQPA